MARRPKPVADQLRQAIRHAERRGISRYRIAKDSGISQAQLSRLMAGSVAPRLDTAERIAKVIGFRIVFVADDS